MGNDITFLASNLNLPGYGALGSGIFRGRQGALAYTFDPDGKSKLVVARVPRSRGKLDLLNTNASVTVISDDTHSHQEDGRSVPEECSRRLLGKPTNIYTDFRCIEESMTNYTLVKLSDPSGSIHACSHGMCCTLDYSSEGIKENFYFGVVNGSQNLFERYSWCIENCLLVRCDPLGEKPCVTFPMQSKTVFNSVQITANFTTHTVFPSVIYSGMRLAPTNEWAYQQTANKPILGLINFKSEDPKPLLVAALNGRCYDRDPPYVR